MEWWFFISARRLVMLYISTKFCEIISNGIKVIERTRFLYWKFQRGIIPQKNVGGVTVVNLCTSSDHALHLCQVSWNYLERYQSYRADTNDQPLTDGRTDRRTDTQKFGGYNIIPRHFLWRGIKTLYDNGRNMVNPVTHSQQPIFITLNCLTMAYL